MGTGNDFITGKFYKYWSNVLKFFNFIIKQLGTHMVFIFCDTDLCLLRIGVFSLDGFGKSGR